MNHIGLGRVMAFDRAPGGRSYDADGRLRVACVNMTKANVCPYLGSEIPDWAILGLNPDREYKLYRDPDALQDALPTANNLPLLFRHVVVTADDHKPDDVVGSTGSQAEWVAPYIQNSIVVWARKAIAAIETGRQRELSAAYRYRADMRSGSFDGERFDGRMVDIAFNHLALVEIGRAGGDVVVGDGARNRFDYASMFPELKRTYR